MIGIINLCPCGEVVGFHLEIVARCAGLDMRAGVHVHPILPVSIVGMADRYGAGSGFGSAGDCDNCRALAVTLPVVSTSATAGLSLVQVRLPAALTGSFTAES